MKILPWLFGCILLLFGAVSCDKVVTFGDSEQLPLPQLSSSEAQLLWIGPDYKLAVNMSVSDNEGIHSIRIKNGEWRLDTTIELNGPALYTIKDTFNVSKDVNRTEHVLELIITNAKGGVVKKNIAVEDLSSENLIPGYNPDILPPDIVLLKPTTTKFLGFSPQPISINIEADITDQELERIEVKVWGEAVDGEAIEHSEIIEFADIADKSQYHYLKDFSLPGGKVGQYQYIVRSIDASGNKKTVGGTISVGLVDRLYLSDAKNQNEVTAQGYDHYGGCRGIGTIYSMKKQGANTFLIDYYYTGEKNIRFIAFIGNDKPFNNTGGSQAGINYSLTGENVAALHKSQPGTITTNLDDASFGLPSDDPGYYHITVDMSQRTITATRYNPTLPVDPIKYPGWSDSAPWEYMSVTGSTVDGGAGGWTEVATSPKLMRDSQNKYLFKGTFKTIGSSSNMSLNAPLAVTGDDVWNKGWFRLIAARAAMVDDYGDPVTIIGPVGASSGGANWGFSTSPAGTYEASYDLILNRLRLVRIGP
ncbi:hypothetical protein PIECOFPK_02559 [Mycovorax composti]|uniref:Uncharacterized protein n=1 Tax=Mycovorax composti TaxID=2962693 RepID=A0ABZ2EMY8_9BACT